MTASPPVRRWRSSVAAKRRHRGPLLALTLVVASASSAAGAAQRTTDEALAPPHEDGAQSEPHSLPPAVECDGSGGGLGTDVARETLGEMLDALGGREAIAEVRSLSVEAACTGPDGAFRTRVDSLLTGSTYFEQSDGERTTRVWGTPERVWTAAADGSYQDLDAGLRHFLRGHEFHLQLFEIERRFSEHREVGRALIIGRGCCSEIEMVDEAGQPASICVWNSGLPYQLTTNPEGAAGPITVTFQDWRTLDGVRYFFGFDLSEGSERHFTYDYERIEPNAVPAELFVAPPPPEHAADHQAILEILRRDRRAHLETDATLIAENLAESVLEISDGRAVVRGRDELAAFFETIFEGVTYSFWEDATPPVIRLSDDASMAWVARTVRVGLTSAGPDGGEIEQRFTSAYTSTYEKREGEWKMTSVTSTFLPPA